MESLIYFFMHLFLLVYYYKQRNLSFSHTLFLEVGLFFIYDFLNIHFFIFYPCLLIFLYIFTKHISMIAYFILSDLCFQAFPLEGFNYLFILIPLLLITCIKKENELFYLSCFLYIDNLTLHYTTSYSYLGHAGGFIFIALVLLIFIFIYFFTQKEKQYLEIYHKHENYQSMKEMDQHLRALHHDLKYQYLSSNKELNPILERELILYTKDSEINYVLNQCIFNAKEKGIDVKCMVSLYDLNNYTFDFNRLFHLIFHKVIDSCLYEEEKLIYLRIEQEEDGIYIKVEFTGKDVLFNEIHQFITIYKGTSSLTYKDKTIFKAWIPRKEDL